MRAFFALTLVVGVPFAAHADVAFLQAASDNTLFQSATGALSNGAGPNIFAGRNSQGLIRRALLEFDISAIPAGSTITGVTLTLVASQTQGPSTPVGLHRTLSAWGEGASMNTGGQGAPAQPGDATWLHTFFDASLWGAQGGDFEGSASASTPVSGPGVYTWLSTPELVADVQAWVDNPSSNYGWTLLGDEANSGTAKRFESRENSAEASRPVLAVEYVIPAPGPIAALGGACVFAGARRPRRPHR